MKQYNKNNIPLAKSLRKNMTPWERKLWYEFLRSYPVRFQRQKCIGNFIVDFYCAKAGLVVELDGSQHYFNEYKKSDCIRTEKLAAENLVVIRIPNCEIDVNFEGVCEYIDNVVKSSLPQSAAQPAPSSEGAKNEQAGLYFHIPFCKSKCPYCDFYSVKYDEQSGEEYINKTVEIIKQYQGSFDTVYFGGGTPSILPPDMLRRLLDSAREQYDISDNAEITVECNPSLDLGEKMKAYADMGINRVSIGMQSAVDKERFALGRSAGRRQVENAVNSARRAGIMNISLDLMLGVPHQSIDTLDESLDFVLSTGVTHLSAYMLKIEEGTKFFDIKNRLVLPDEDEVCEMYLKTVDTMNRSGLTQYEISNFARNGMESKHNIKYWTLCDYLGIGKSAHSFWHGKRFYYDRDYSKINDGTGGDTEERIMLGLRLNKGINKNIINKDISLYIRGGLMCEKGDNIALTPQGMLLSNTIISSLI